MRVIGRQACRDEAAVLVLAPHSSFLDSVIVYVTNMCSVMVRKESMDNFAGSKFGRKDHARRATECVRQTQTKY